MPKRVPVDGAEPDALADSSKRAGAHAVPERSPVLGRKNWLFVEGDLNGERTAAILTIIGTCIAQRIDPRAYLHLVTRLIVEKWPRARYAELLPAALATTHPELRLSTTRPRPALPRAP